MADDAKTSSLLEVKDPSPAGSRTVAVASNTIRGVVDARSATGSGRGRRRASSAGSRPGGGSTDLVVTRCERPSAGLSSETLMVETRGTRRRGGARRSRSSCGSPRRARGSSPRYDLEVQARAQEAAAAGRRPDRGAGRARDRSQMARRPVPRHAGGRGPRARVDARSATRGSPSRSRVRRGCPRRSTTSSSTLHRIDWRASGLDAVIPVRDIGAELAAWHEYLDWYGDGSVIGARAARRARWCEAHRPAHDPPARVPLGRRPARQHHLRRRRGGPPRCSTGR